MELVRRPPRWGLVLRILISGGILAWLAFKVDWTDLLGRLRAADPAWLAAAVLAAGATFALAARRWQFLLKVHDIDPGFPLLLRVTLIGQFFNAFLFGTTGGDVVKIVYIAQASPGRKTAAGLSVLLDRVIGLAALILLALLCTLPFHALLAATSAARGALHAFYLLSAAVGAALLLAALLPRLTARLRAWEGKIPFHDRIERLSEALHRNVHAGRANAGAFCLSLLIHPLNLFSLWGIARALHAAVPFLLMAGVSAVILVLISIPVSISGLGVRESLYIVFLGLPGLDVPRDGALAVSLLGFFLSLCWSLVGGVVYLRYHQSFAASPGPGLEAAP